jgi:hypothetical protein
VILLARTFAALFRDHTARYAVSRVARWVGLVVVGLGVNYDCRPAVAEQGVGTVRKGYVVVLKSESVSFALSIDGEVLHIASVVAVGIIETVFLAIRIEMSTGRLEIGAFALGHLMEVEGMLSGREIVKVKLDDDARPFLREGNGANTLSLRICEFNLELNLGLGRAPGWEDSHREEQPEGEICEAWHR